MRSTTLEHPSRLRVLVVDDEPLTCWSLVETLGERGDITTVAPNGQLAVRALMDATAPVDVVLLDYSLPDSTDLRLLATCRRLSPESHVILMTAHGTPELTKEAMALGAYRVLDKPFDLSDVAALVHEAHASDRLT